MQCACMRACVCLCVHACVRACVRACFCARVFLRACMRVFACPEMKDFPNTPEIHDFLLANLGNLDKSMISGKFPQAKPFENRNFSPRNISPRNLNFSGKGFSGKCFSGEMFLGERVSVESGFPEIFPDSGISGIAKAPRSLGN